MQLLLDGGLGEIESPRRRCASQDRPGRSEGGCRQPRCHAGVRSISPASCHRRSSAGDDRLSRPQQRYLFLNQTLAEWLEQPRKSILAGPCGRWSAKKAYEFRQPMVEAALRGEQQWFIADFEHSTRGTLTVQAQYVPHLGAKER